MFFQLAPVVERALQHAPRSRAEFVAGVFDRIGQFCAQGAYFRPSWTPVSADRGRHFR
jgi:hypothetical protein